MEGMRITIGENTTTTQPQADASQIRTGEEKHMSVTLSDSGVMTETSGVQQATSSPIKEDFSPFGSIQTAHGDSIGADMTKADDNCSIAFGSERTRTTIGAAIHQGLLIRTADGSLHLTEFGQDTVSSELGKRIDQMKTKINEADNADLPLSQQVMRDASQLTQRGGPGVQAALADGIEAMITGDSAAYQKAVFDISQTAGATGIDGFMAAYGEEASMSLAADLGEMMSADPDNIYDFAVDTIPARELAQIITAHAQGDRTVVQAVREKYGDRFASWLRIRQ